MTDTKPARDKAFRAHVTRVGQDIIKGAGRAAQEAPAGAEHEQYMLYAIRVLKLVVFSVVRATTRGEGEQALVRALCKDVLAEMKRTPYIPEGEVT